MGNYTQLYIGKLYLSWKNFIPDFLTFLFDEQDFYSVYNVDEPERPAKIGFRTTCAKSINMLERNGYTVGFFTDVYDFFEKKLNAEFEDSAKKELAEQSSAHDEAQLRRMLAHHLDAFPTLSPAEQLHDFIEFLKVLLSADFNSPPFKESVFFRLNDGRRYEIPPDEFRIAERFEDVQIIDLQKLEYYVYNRDAPIPALDSEALPSFSLGLSQRLSRSTVSHVHQACPGSGRTQ